MRVRLCMNFYVHLTVFVCVSAFVRVSRCKLKCRHVYSGINFNIAPDPILFLSSPSHTRTLSLVLTLSPTPAHPPTHIHQPTPTYPPTHSRIQTHTYTLTHKYTRTHMHTHMHIRTHARTKARTFARKHTHARTHTCTHILRFGQKRDGVAFALFHRVGSSATNTPSYLLRKGRKHR